MAIVAGGLAYYFLQNQYDQARLEAEDRLRLMVNAVELRLENVVEDLQILASSPALQNGDIETFNRHATSAQPVLRGVGIVLVDADGQQLLNTRLPPGSPLPKRTNLDTQNLVFATGRPQASGVIRAAVDARPIVSVEVPVFVDGKVKHALATGLTPDYVEDVVAKHVPLGWIGSIADRDGILFSRVPERGVVGQPIIPELRERIGQASGHWIEITSRDGTPIYSSFLRSEKLGWTAHLSRPRAAIHAQVLRVMWVLVAIYAGGLLLSTALAQWLSRRVVGSLGRLDRNVAAIGKGTRPVSSPKQIAEVDRMESLLSEVANEIATARDNIDRERLLLKATVRSMPIGVLVLAPNHEVLLANERLAALWELSDVQRLADLASVRRTRLDGTPYPPEEWPVVRALTRGELTMGEEVIQLLKDGTRRRLAINAAPVRDGSGTTLAAVVAVYDMTDLRTAVERQNLLVLEINHRVKNTMATIQSVLRLTSKGATSIEGFVSSMERRLIALSGAYDLLTVENWEGASLRAIVERTLAAFADADRVIIDGPEVRLTPRLTIAVAAAVQELTTNAAKYGSLSASTGKVHVSWRSQSPSDILFQWHESGGPPVRNPSRKGFGTLLIQQMLASDSGWDADIEYRPTGLCCSIRITLG